MSIIQRDRSIIPACDVDLDLFESIVRETSDVEGVGGYKIPAVSGRKGWETWVATARRHTEKPLIFDGQKWGNDIPDTGPKIMKEIKESGFDAVILFPFTGPITQYEWTMAARELSLPVIMGGKMTHPRQMTGDTSDYKDKNFSKIFMDLGFEKDLTGYIREDAPQDMVKLAARLGIDNYVAPGNQPLAISHMKSLLEELNVEPVFYAPGFVAQGGTISEGGQAAGERFHAIVGRGIYWNKDRDRFNHPAEIRDAAEELTSKL